MRLKILPGTVLTPEELAQRARLRYVSDEDAGYARRRNGRGFVYLDSRGQPLRDERKIGRIEKLAIPPAWKKVWICRYANAHLQATGRDGRQRKQYLYHERWREAANLAKFLRLERFGKLLPKLRRELVLDLKPTKPTRRRVLAGMVALLDATAIRIGNEEYVVENNSFGLSTLRNRHLTLGRGTAELSFRGKGGLRRNVIVDAKPLVRLIRQCRALEGVHLFQYIDADGAIRQADAVEVNEYLQEMLGEPFTAKDFRIWKASSVVAAVLWKHRHLERITRRKKVLKEAIAAAAEALGNTPTVCRKYYIHPQLGARFEAGELAADFGNYKPRSSTYFSVSERVLAHFLRRLRLSLRST